MLFDNYYQIHGDPRALEYPLMESPKPTLIISFIYLVFVKLVGPALMKNRTAFQFRTLMAIYNFILVIFSVWAFLHFFYRWVTKYNFRCEPVDYSDDEDAAQVLYVCWWFYISKLVELADTVFFILRKKDSQVTFLHVLHHTLTPITMWIVTKYSGGGSNTFLPMINSFVHIWMYTYYGLSGMGPAVQKYIWWKKYMTTLQLVQFTLDFFYYVTLIFFPPENCQVFPPVAILMLFESVLYFCLFMTFYLKSYHRKPHKT